MKILFVCSGNKSNGPGMVVKNQADSLQQKGVHIEFFTIVGKGFRGYIRNISPLVQRLKKKDVDLVHSHYSLSALVTTISLIFTSKFPHIVSLMGSDAKMKGLVKLLIRFLSRYIWSFTIVKSSEMFDCLTSKKAEIIPNGVDLAKIDRIKEQIQDENDKTESPGSENSILFAADPGRRSKNYRLAEQATNRTGTELKVAFSKSHEDILAELLRARVLLSTSLWEGSPNIIKEAMACNCPIVSTDVGDVAWLLDDLPGHYITEFDPEDVAKKITIAMEFSEVNGRTEGRNRIIDLGLDADTTAEKIIKLYHRIM
jgi:glycosyltransferase involved in cell wall biosynthesis